MNAQDRVKINEFDNKLDLLDQEQRKLAKKVDRILDVLQDDQYSTDKGLITEVNRLNDEVEKLLYVNTAIKKFFWWIMGIVAAILTVIGKIVLIDE